MNTSEAQDEEIVQATRPSEEEIFVKEWGKDSLKCNIPLLNEILRSLLTLSTALSGSSLLLVPHIALGWRIVVALIFLAALLVSVRGVLPFAGEATFIVPQQILMHKAKAAASKLSHVKWAAGLIVAGLVLLMVAMVASVGRSLPVAPS